MKLGRWVPAQGQSHPSPCHLLKQQSGSPAEMRARGHTHPSPPVLSVKEKHHKVTLFNVRTWPGFLARLPHPAGAMSHKLSPEVTNTAPHTIKLHILQHIILLGFGKVKSLHRRQSRNYDELFPAGLLVIVAGIKSSSRLQIFPCQALSLSPALLSLSGVLFTRFS